MLVRVALGSLRCWVATIQVANHVAERRRRRQNAVRVKKSVPAIAVTIKIIIQTRARERRRITNYPSLLRLLFLHLSYPKEVPEEPSRPTVSSPAQDPNRGSRPGLRQPRAPPAWGSPGFRRVGASIKRWRPPNPRISDGQEEGGAPKGGSEALGVGV